MIVLDTNVISEFMRATPSELVDQWASERPASERYTTSVTLAEISYGIARLPDGARKAALRVAADEAFDAYSDRVLSFDESAALAYGEIMAAADLRGNPVGIFDAQIAAICHAHDVALATRNVRDFLGMGIHLIDPWQA